MFAAVVLLCAGACAQEVGWSARRARNATVPRARAARRLVFASTDSGPREATWAHRVSRKRRCLQRKAGGVYLYHTRKAAGTTLREVLKSFCGRRCRVWETEGMSIDSGFLALTSVVTVVSLRDPVARIESLFWYEHVGWWDGVRHDQKGLRPYAEWVAEWSDGSEWKKEFARKNPQNVYVEVQNYYTKMLTGWRGETLAVDAGARAREALERFDVVFIVERAREPEHLALLAQALGLPSVTLPSTLQGDASAKRRLAPRLAPDAAAVRETLRRLNAQDLALYAFALALDDARVAHGRLERPVDSRPLSDEPCAPPPPKLGKLNGIFRPPGHKH